MNILAGIDFKQPVFQIAIAISLVLVVGVILFAIVYSILTGSPLSPAISNLIAFLLGGGLTATGGQLGVSHYARGQAEAS
jgi:predicted RND superfamily exporter protein